MFDLSRADQLDQIARGRWDLNPPKENQIWVRTRDNATGDDLVDLDVETNGVTTTQKWRLVEWEPDNYEVQDPARNRSHDDETRD